MAARTEAMSPGYAPPPDGFAHEGAGPLHGLLVMEVGDVGDDDDGDGRRSTVEAEEAVQAGGIGEAQVEEDGIRREALDHGDHVGGGRLGVGEVLRQEVGIFRVILD